VLFYLRNRRLFEEYAVRSLTDLAMADALSKDLDGFLRMLIENN